jgi:FAD binding domain
VPCASGSGRGDRRCPDVPPRAHGARPPRVPDGGPARPAVRQRGTALQRRGPALQDFDPSVFAYPRAPAWLVFDADYRARYNLGPLERGAPDPDWLARAPDLPTLAESIDVPSATLTATVDRFNALCAGGVTMTSGADRLPTTGSSAPHPTLAPLVSPPYYAVRILPGCLGMRGGPPADDRGRVLGVADAGRSRAFTPPAMRLPAPSVSPTPAQEGPSGRRWSSAGARARRPVPMADAGISTKRLVEER